MNYSQIPGASVALPLTSGLAVAYRSVWLGVAIAVIGTTLITVTKFFPRLAIEPVARGGRHRMGVTVNGHPVGKPKSERPTVVTEPGVALDDTVTLYRVTGL